MKQTIELRHAPPRAPRVRTIRIALAGAGTVGSALIRLLDESREIQERQGIRFAVTQVLVRDTRRERGVSVDRSRFTSNVDDFVATGADMVVDAMGGIDPALRIAATALGRAIPYVTANKALLAAYGPELAELARRSGTRFGFEATVAGGVPVVRVLRDALPWAGVRRIRGVLNGTTNFLLDRMHAGDSAESALAEAQRLGFAEADPSRDVSGQDSADKIALLAWLAWGVHPARSAVEPHGITRHAGRLVADAQAFGGVTRLIAEGTRVDAGVRLVVRPVALAADSPLARTRAEDNTVQIETATNGVITLSGPGAGGAPTASALFGDMLAPPPPPPAPERSVAPGAVRHGRWLVGVAGNGRTSAAADTLLAGAGVGVVAVRTDGNVTRFLTEPSSDVRMARVLAKLDAAALEPVLQSAELGAAAG